MKNAIVRYKAKPGEASRNEELVRRVDEEVHQAEPDGLRYATVVLDDGVSFVHVASVDAAEGENPLHGVAAFRAFPKGIGKRCEDLPVQAALREVGSYRFWGEGGRR